MSDIRVFFLHRSVGQQIVDASGLRRSGVSLDDLNANTMTLTTAQGHTDTCRFEVPDGNTNPEGLERFFASGSNRRLLAAYDVIAFKSCYTASNIDSEEQRSEYIRAYSRIFEWIDAQEGKRFILSSSPPRKAWLTKPVNVTRTLSFFKWLALECDSRENCSFADFHSTLANPTGTLAKSYARLAPWDQHPNDAGARAAATLFDEQVRALLLDN